MGFPERYKNIGFGRENVGVNRTLRSQRRDEFRREMRNKHFSLRRDFDSGIGDEKSNLHDYESEQKTADGQSAVIDMEVAVQNRLERLSKWKEERNRKKILEKQHTKPVFKVGIVHHKIFSPTATNKQNAIATTKLCKQKAQNSDLPKRVTRATEKRLALKAAEDVKKPVKSSIKKKKTEQKNIGKLNEDDSILPKEHRFKAPEGIFPLPMFGKRALETKIQEGSSSKSKNDLTQSLNLTEEFHLGSSILHSTVASQYDLKNSIKDSIWINNQNSNIDSLNLNSSEENFSLKLSSDDQEILSQTAGDAINNSENICCSGSENSQSFDKSSKKKSDLENSPKITCNDSNNISELNSKPTKSEVVKNEEPTLNSSDNKLQKSVGSTRKSLNISNAEPIASDLNKSLSAEKPPAFFSPFIVTSRGKRNVRKEQLKRMSLASPEAIPTKDTVMQNLNFTVQDEEKTAKYYRYILDKENERLTELCNKWNDIKDNTNNLPEDAHYLINQAVGQTNLLMRKKFERFRNLVFDCETGKGEMLVTCIDLQGFWDMMYKEVENCDERFSNLEKLKTQNWVEEVENIPQKKKMVKKHPIKRKNVQPSKPSNLRAHIMAARKKKLEQCNGNIDTKFEAVNISGKEFSKEPNTTESSLKESAQSFFTTKSVTPKSNNKMWPSLLHKVQQQNLTKKKVTTSPLVVMKVSQMIKTPEVHLDDSIIYINSNRTPAKGILKPSRDENILNKSLKSGNKVNFQVESVEISELNQNFLDNNLNTPLSTSNTEINEGMKIFASTERKLDFESSDSSDEDTITPVKSSKQFETRLTKSPVVSLIPLQLPKENVFLKSTTPEIPKITAIRTSPIVSMSPINTLSNGGGKNKTSFNLSLTKIEVNPVVCLSPLKLEERQHNIKSDESMNFKKISFKEDFNTSTRTLRNRSLTFNLTPTVMKKRTLKPDSSTSSFENNIVNYRSKLSDSPLTPTPVTQYLRELHLNKEENVETLGKRNKKILLTPKFQVNSEKASINKNMEINENSTPGRRLTLTRTLKESINTPKGLSSNIAINKNNGATSNKNTPALRRTRSRRSKFGGLEE